MRGTDMNTLSLDVTWLTPPGKDTVWTLKVAQAILTNQWMWTSVTITTIALTTLGHLEQLWSTTRRQSPQTTTRFPALWKACSVRHLRKKSQFTTPTTHLITIRGGAILCLLREKRRLYSVVDQTITKTDSIMITDNKMNPDSSSSQIQDKGTLVFRWSAPLKTGSIDRKWTTVVMVHWTTQTAAGVVWMVIPRGTQAWNRNMNLEDKSSHSLHKDPGGKKLLRTIQEMTPLFQDMTSQGTPGDLWVMVVWEVVTVILLCSLLHLLFPQHFPDETHKKCGL